MFNRMVKNCSLPIFLLIMFVFLVIQAFVYQQGLITGRISDLVDTDTFMRLVRVEQLAESGGWYDSFIHRSNYPYGDNLHWTRPLDILLLVGAYLLTPILGFHKALLYWGIVISPIIGIFSLVALYWAVKPVINRNSRHLLWLLFISQTVLLQVFYFGRPDHHSLLLFLFILLMGCLFRIISTPENHKYAVLGGIIAALSLWVSIETIFAMVVVYIALGFLWLTREESFSRQILLFSLSVLMASTVFLLIERPVSGLLVVEYDKISIVHLYVFTISALASYLLNFHKTTSIGSKLRSVALLLAASGLLIWWVFPDFFRGPMAGVNKAIVPIWLDRVSEVQPLWKSGVFHEIAVIGSVALFLIYLVYLHMAKEFTTHANLVIPSVCGFVVFLPLGLYQVRMCTYLMLIVTICLAVFLDVLIRRISQANISDFAKTSLRVTTIVFFILLLPVTGLLATPDDTNEDTNDENGTNKSNLKSLSMFLNSYHESNPNTATILTFVDFGPELLYRTDYNYIATPYHRNDQGILFNYNVMAEKDLDKVEAMLAERAVGLIIICPHSMEGQFYKKTADRSTFYERLADGKTPPFLKEIEMPADLQDDYHSYRIIN